MSTPQDLSHVDWSALPRPEDDGAARHLPGMDLPDVALPSTAGEQLRLSGLDGTAVLFLYPMTGRPGRALPAGWDGIPGARGCTPQACAFRDLHGALRALGADHVFGVSTQPPGDQKEAAARLHLPYPLLSDEALEFARALRLPVMEVEGRTLLKRMSLVAQDARIAHVRYPVFPPDADASAIADWLRARD